jgi:predicted O-methyltransferase YrrM
MSEPNELWGKVDDYLSGLFLPDDTVQDETLRASDAAGLPQIAVSPAQGKMLSLIAAASKAKNILEIGTLAGYSTIWLARALPPDGKLITLEFDPKHAEVARKNIARAGLDKKVEVRVGRAIDTLPELEAEGFARKFDLVFIDADKPGYTDYLHWSLKLTHPGSLIIADNVVRKGGVIDADSKDEFIQGIRRFNEALSKETSVSATAIQTVGAKGYDGLAFAVVK